MASLVTHASQLLDEMAVSKPVVGSSSPANGAPDIYIGCVPGHDEGSCALGHSDVQIFARQGTSGWIGRTRNAARTAKVEYVIAVMLQVARWTPRSDGVGGVLEIGTGRRVHVPTTEPVRVLQFAGAIIDGDGNVLRAGAEGFAVLEQSRRALSARDVEQIAEDRREDLAGAPLAWRVALENLIGELLRRDRLIRR
jgi:hypothetical protein